MLLQDIEQHRNRWRMGMVVSVFRSQTDGKVGSVEVWVIKDDKTVNCVRPVTELVLLLNTV